MGFRGNDSVILGLIILAVASRWLPHPPNFSPVIAIALFAGARFDSKRLAILVPLVAMIVSDLLLGWHATIPFVYGSLILMSLAGSTWLKPCRFGWLKLGSSATAGSVLFFGLTNFGTWLMQDLYTKDLQGLMACYTAAIPFFPATIASAWMYGFALFALASIADHWLEPSRVPQSSK